MSLSNDILSQFAKVTKPSKQNKKESLVNGTVVLYNNKKYVRFDGSDGLLTPITDDTDIVNGTVDIKEGDRVTVRIKNHEATVTGNLSGPAPRINQLIELENGTKELIADKAIIGELVAKKADIDELTAKKADIKELTAEKATILELTADKADIQELVANKADIKDLTAKKAAIIALTAEDADVNNLTARYAKIDFANVNAADIDVSKIKDLYVQSGIISDASIQDGRVTGKLVGVKIIGDLIEGNTIKADKLVVKGNDGLFYKLNTDGVNITAEQTEYNSLNGSVITAESVTADKISVSDLVAFGATIGGFILDSDSIHSLVKNSVTSPLAGLYMNKDGEIAFGDENNYVKCYKDTNDNNSYKIEISAKSLRFDPNGETVEESINGLNESMNSTAESIQSSLSNDIKKTKDDINKEIDNKLDGYVNNSKYSKDQKEVNNEIDNTKQIAIDLAGIVAESTNLKFEELATYVLMDEDGLTLGKDGNPIKLKIDHDRIRFLKNDNPIGWWDGVNFHTGNVEIEVKERAQFGNFAFVPRSDGSLSFLKVDSVVSDNLFDLASCQFGNYVTSYEPIGSTGAYVYESSHIKGTWPNTSATRLVLDTNKKYRITGILKNAGFAAYGDGVEKALVDEDGFITATFSGAATGYIFASDRTPNVKWYSFQDMRLVEVR